MGRYYEAVVNVVKPRNGRQRAIVHALKATGLEGGNRGSDRMDDTGEGFQLVSQVWLAAGEMDDLYADALARLIWEANGEFCKVEITMIYLEDQPREEYEFDHDEYDEWVITFGKGGGNKPSILCQHSMRCQGDTCTHIEL